MADELSEAKETAAKASSSGKSPLLTILVLVNTIVMLGVAYLQYDSHVKEANRPTLRDIIKAEMKTAGEETDEVVGAAKDEDGINFPLETFTANLAQGDGPR